VPGQIGPATLIRHRAHDAARLVEHEVALGRVELHGRAVDLHPVGLRMDAGAELGHDASVDAHAARDDVLLAHATGRDPRGREHLLEALALSRRWALAPGR